MAPEITLLLTDKYIEVLFTNLNTKKERHYKGLRDFLNFQLIEGSNIYPIFTQYFDFMLYSNLRKADIGLAVKLFNLSLLVYK